ncbi:very-short-patch-repair endonuclease [Altererythrobacter atlanticus]|uniref:Uncharacterized protein n=1 Tax=Croceibacterium atlanticum TaxID=1267766 RepID=A0A0F7KQU2_9SPHN|nr:DUF559 domain-containing protein [Croceibacterium atlanticum]AKH41190.1 hypothetical protein WYH_00124 [Croceibacterium atlanticum]MBB5732707.1 very-short-patch-repair endonuclease [Croceibacterium atlanticum]
MFRDPAPKSTQATTRRARSLRRRMSLPEVLLWRYLRGQPGGIKFRRQHQTGPYVLDFYCMDASLAVEVDGKAHDDPTRAARDEARDAWLARHGIGTLRIPAREILADPARAAEALLDHARSRLPLHHPAAPGGPPPRAKLGEDQKA